MEAISRAERILTGEDLEPISREEHFLAKIAGKDVETPEPISRKEHFLQEIIDNGGSGGITPTGTIDITENGNYDVTNYANANVIVFTAGGGSSEDMLQARVNETNSCMYLFHNYEGTNPDIVKNLDTSSVTNMNNMFQSCTELPNLNLSNFNTSSVTSMRYMFMGCNKLTSLDLSNFNTSSVTDMLGMFKNCNKLTSLDLSNFNTSQITSTNYMFQTCEYLQNIIGVLDVISCTTVTKMFDNCYNLQSFTLKNIKRNLQIGSGTSWGHLLTLDTLINTIKELWDYSSGTTTYTLTMGSANLEKIANTYVKLITPTEEQITADPNITSKLPCEVCESTDEGAMLIKDYALLKNWNIT